MNVGELLDLEENSQLLDQARARWSQWKAADSRLDDVENFEDLRGWLAAAAPAEADRVLLALAMLAAPDGGDDLAAAGALAKCLLPGACRLAAAIARTLYHLLPGDLSVANELVASQLWIEVRSFKWRKNNKVAANILANTRAGVLRECGEITQISRTDQTWAHTDLVDAVTTGDPAFDGDFDIGGTQRQQHAAGWQPGLLTDPEPIPGEHASELEEVLELLAWACAEEVISPADRYLLLCLADEADRADARRNGRGYGGLLGNDVSRKVADRIGSSEATVRRRGSKSIRALAAAVPERFNDAH